MGHKLYYLQPHRSINAWKIGKKTDVGKLKCKIENAVNSRPGSTQRKKELTLQVEIYTKVGTCKSVC